MDLKEMVPTISGGTHASGYSSTDSDLHDKTVKEGICTDDKIVEIHNNKDTIPSTKANPVNKLQISVDTHSTTVQISVQQQIKQMHQTYDTNIKLIMLFSTICLNIVLFLDAYYVMNDIKYIEDLMKTTLSVMGSHLVIEHVLENIIYSIKSENLILYSTTACLRDIFNNIVMTCFFIFDDYGYWWRPLMWGCYMADLVMLLSKWNLFKSSWLKFVFMHHFGVAVMLFILNHTTKILTDNALICLILFMNSNSFGCASPIWKAFKLPYYKHSTIICFILQRMVRFAAYGWISQIKMKHFLKQDYGYIVLTICALILDVWDIYSQILSIWNYYKKQKIQKKSVKSEIKKIMSV